MSEPTKNEAELNRTFTLGQLLGLEEASGILMLQVVKALEHKKPEADLLRSLSVELSRLAQGRYPEPLVIGVAERKARACNAENAKTWEVEFHAERKLRKEWEELSVDLSRKHGSAEKRAIDNGNQAAAYLEELEGLRRKTQLHKEAKWDAEKRVSRLRHLLRLAREWVAADKAIPSPELTRDIDEVLRR